MSEKRRLIGSDGAVWAGRFGENLIVGEILLPNRSYKIVAIDDTTSIFPTGAEVGYLFDTGLTGGQVLEAGDICQLFDGIAWCDLSTWSLDFSKAEVETTVMCDTSKVYRASKYDDISGNLEGIMITGITDKENGLLNQFATIVKQDDTTYEIFPKESVDLFVQLYTDTTEESGEDTGYYFTPIVLTGFSASAGGDDAQTFSSPFRVAASDVGVVYYSIVNA